MPPTDSVRDAAARWVTRTRDPAFADWVAFTGWLEADAAHNRAYEAALHAHDAAGLLDRGDASPMATAANDDGADHIGSAPGRRMLRWAGAAAVLLAAGVSIPLLSARPDHYSVISAPGQAQSITLRDGSRIALNGGSKLVLDRNAPRFARLDYGEASFMVVHDAAHPFSVEAGGTRMIDLGTRFNVVRNPRSTEVAVAEGALLFDPDGAAVRLTPGRVIRSSDETQMLELADMDPTAIGSWRTGTLLYRDATIGQIAADLARGIGEPVMAAPEVAARRFSGDIAVRGIERRRLFDDLAGVLDVSVVHRADGWHLNPRARASR